MLGVRGAGHWVGVPAVAVSGGVIEDGREQVGGVGVRSSACGRLVGASLCGLGLRALRVVWSGSAAGWGSGRCLLALWASCCSGSCWPSLLSLIVGSCLGLLDVVSRVQGLRGRALVAGDWGVVGPCCWWEGRCSGSGLWECLLVGRWWKAFGLLLLVAYLLAFCLGVMGEKESGPGVVDGAGDGAGDGQGLLWGSCLPLLGLLWVG